MYDLDIFMEELDRFYEENENRSKNFKLLIDPFKVIKVDYNGAGLQIENPIMKVVKKKKITIVYKKDINSKKNLF